MVHYLVECYDAKSKVNFGGFRFTRPLCLATLKSCDKTKQSVCGWLYIYFFFLCVSYQYIGGVRCIMVTVVGTGNEFKSWARLFAFVKVIIQFVTFLMLLDNQTDKARQLCMSTTLKERKLRIHMLHPAYIIELLLIYITHSYIYVYIYIYIYIYMY